MLLFDVMELRGCHKHLLSAKLEIYVVASPEPVANAIAGCIARLVPIYDLSYGLISRNTCRRTVCVTVIPLI